MLDSNSDGTIDLQSAAGTHDSLFGIKIGAGSTERKKIKAQAEVEKAKAQSKADIAMADAIKASSLAQSKASTPSSTGIPSWIWIGGGVLLFVIILVVVLLIVKSRKKQ